MHSMGTRRQQTVRMAGGRVRGTRQVPYLRKEHIMAHKHLDGLVA